MWAIGNEASQDSIFSNSTSQVYNLVFVTQMTINYTIVSIIVVVQINSINREQ